MPIRFFALVAISLLAACSPANNSLQPVTPLPTSNAEATIAPTVESALPTSTQMPTDGAAIGAATSTPLTINLNMGEARAIAAATDAALQPTPRQPILFDSEPISIQFDEFYDGYNMRTGLVLSDKLVSLDGRTAILEGYMAPPLKAELDYFVVTRIQLSFCPFCSTAADWPDDIALVYMPEGQGALATDRPVRIIGRMEIGRSVDHETGMVSLVRLFADRVEIIG